MYINNSSSQKENTKNIFLDNYSIYFKTQIKRKNLKRFTSEIKGDTLGPDEVGAIHDIHISLDLMSLFKNITQGFRSMFWLCFNLWHCAKLPLVQPKFSFSISDSKLVIADLYI